MTYDEFLELVARMRRAQRQYFATRDAADLERSKELERTVDRVVKDRGQQHLFGR